MLPPPQKQQALEGLSQAQGEILDVSGPNVIKPGLGKRMLPLALDGLSKGAF